MKILRIMFEGCKNARSCGLDFPVLHFVEQRGGKVWGERNAHLSISSIMLLEYPKLPFFLCVFILNTKEEMQQNDAYIKERFVGFSEVFRTQWCAFALENKKARLLFILKISES